MQHEVKRQLKSLAYGLLRRTRAPSFKVKQRYSEWQAKRVVLDEGLALTGRELSWFYTAFERSDHDPLTNFALSFIEENVAKTASILVTGCGTGIPVFHLADSGFSNIEGRDLLEKCIRVARRLQRDFGYEGITFRVDDGFNPVLTSKYDLITALHWVFSAWMGNYGNNAVEDPRSPAVRERLLNVLLEKYSTHLNSGGLMLIELTDAVADYREPYDHPAGMGSRDIYPVRHTPEQVGACARLAGLEVIDKRLCVSYGHDPRTSYVLRRL